MNCSQARALLAIYRELKEDHTDTKALHVHLSQCEECRNYQARYQSVGDKIRALPTLEPAPDAHTRLMQALAKEHVRFIQRVPASAATPPTPTFLAPYLRELAKTETNTDNLVAFATADTGPLPVIRSIKPRRSHRLNHFAVIGIAASFLLMLMTGGLISMLMLNPSTPITPSTISVLPLSEVQPRLYEVTSNFTHVASAVEVGEAIYYTTRDDTTHLWQIERFDEKSETSIPLLPQASTNELLILGGSEQWLAYIEIEPEVEPIIAPTNPEDQDNKDQNTETNDQQSEQVEQEGKKTQQEEKPEPRLWSLYLIQLNSIQVKTQEIATPTVTPTATATPTATPTVTVPTNTTTTTTTQVVEMERIAVIDKQKFDMTTIPGWITRPVQGIWFTNQALLVSMFDAQGLSHLIQYNILIDDQKQEKEEDQKESYKLEAITLASAEAGHVLNSPTANSDGNAIFWGEVWANEEGRLLGNIWTQQTVNAQPTPGKWANHQQTLAPALFRQDGASFRPQIVNDTLFFLTTGKPENDYQPPVITPTVETTPSVTPTTEQKSGAMATPITTSTPYPTIDPAGLQGGSMSIDPTLFKPQLDETISGRILAYSTTGVAKELTRFDTTKQVSGLQGGAHFLIWKEADNTIGMYDVVSSQPVNVGVNMVPTNASFLSINGDTAVVIVNNAQEQKDANVITFHTFKWPWNIKQTTPTPEVQSSATQSTQ